jgi:hypothetical protein
MDITVTASVCTYRPKQLQYGDVAKPWNFKLHIRHKSQEPKDEEQNWMLEGISKCIFT